MIGIGTPGSKAEFPRGIFMTILLVIEEAAFGPQDAQQQSS
jgi:hypothetical protein